MFFVFHTGFTEVTRIQNSQNDMYVKFAGGKRGVKLTRP